MTNSVDPDQTAPIGAVCAGSTLFACILKLASNVRQLIEQTTSADNIFRCIFLGALRDNLRQGCKIPLSLTHRPLALTSKLQVRVSRIPAKLALTGECIF